jgi:hypothetical protein
MPHLPRHRYAIARLVVMGLAILALAALVVWAEREPIRAAMA